MIKQRLINMLSNWLGLVEMRRDIDRVRKDVNAASAIGVDVSFYDTTQIIIVSKVQGGQVRIIPVSLNNLKQIEECVKSIENRYSIKNTPVWDAAPEHQRYLNESNRRRF